MNHTLFKCEETCDNPYCRYCQGGLNFCTICKGVEASMPKECPGVPLNQTQEAMISMAF